MLAELLTSLLGTPTAAGGAGTAAPAAAAAAVSVDDIGVIATYRRQVGGSWLILGGDDVTRRHICHTAMALPTGIVPAGTLGWGQPRPPSVLQTT
mgnify:CR=1 FL=1